MCFISACSVPESGLNMKKFTYQSENIQLERGFHGEQKCENFVKSVQICTIYGWLLVKLKTQFTFRIMSKWNFLRTIFSFLRNDVDVPSSS
jgi:hypothetical protein